VETFVDGVPVYDTTVIVTNPDERIRAGMSAQAEITTREAADVIAVPDRFIFREDGRTYVRVRVGEKTVEERDVELGLRGSDSFIEITSGNLASGDILVRNESN